MKNIEHIHNSYKKIHHFLDSNYNQKKIPLHGSIELTNHCNLNCSHCFINDNSTNELSYSEWLSILNKISEAGCIFLLITGGEIFTRKDFIDIYLHAKKLGFFITLYTNGTLLNKEIVDCLAEYPPLEIEISLYGLTDKVAERFTQKPEYLKLFSQGINLLKNKGINFSLKSTVNEINKKEIPIMIKYAQSLKVYFKFDPIILPRINGNKSHLNLRIPPKDVIKILTENFKLNPFSEKLNSFFNKNNDNLINPFINKMLFSCQIGHKHFHIDSTGMMSPCLLYRDFQYNILKTPFIEAWQNLVSDCKSLTIKNNFDCITCKDNSKCFAWCPAVAKLENGKAESAVSYFCDIMKERSKYLSTKLKQTTN